MERTILESRYMLVVLTPAYQENGFAELELVLADHLGTEKRQSRYMTVLREDFTPASLLVRARSYLDMSGDEKFKDNVIRLVYELKQPPTI